jgi:membrane dipeptidase
MFELGMVVDVSHCDSRTLRDIVGLAGERPVIASHSGARACQDFPRFVTDDEARLIAATGGVIGLWPYRFRHTGIADMAALIAHARHLAGVVGTDMNGVPGTMAGYRGETDVALITAALLADGFTEDEVRGILGGNFLSVLLRSTTAMPW